MNTSDKKERPANYKATFSASTAFYNDAIQYFTRLAEAKLRSAEDMMSKKSSPQNLKRKKFVKHAHVFWKDEHEILKG